MLEKIVKIVGYVVLGLAAIISLLFFLTDAKVLQQGLDSLGDVPAEIKIAEVDKLATDWNALILNSSIALFIISVLAIIIFSITKFIKDATSHPKSAIKPIIAIVSLALVIIVSYLLASDTVPQFLGAKKFDISGSTVRWVETSLFITYILFGISILALIYTEISNIWR